MNEEKIKKILFFLGVSISFIFCLLPFIYMILISFNYSIDTFIQNKFIFTFKNYISIIKGENLHFLDYLKNSLIVSSISAFFTVLIGALGAFAITRLDIKYKFTILFFIIGVSMFPQISMAGYLFKLITRLNLLNTYMGLILPYISWTLPLILWILTGYFSKIPKEIDKAGYIDGATKLQVFYKLIIPLSLPGIFSSFLLAFIFAFNEFLFALILTVDYKSRTVPVGIALFQGLHGEIPWSEIMAASFITVLPIVIITLIFQKYIIQGLLSGSIKE